MADEQKTQLRLEIAHVLFMDIVGYSKLLIDEQSEALQELMAWWERQETMWYFRVRDSVSELRERKLSRERRR